MSLLSEHWSDLEHAYGPASDIPPLLERLRDLPHSDGNSEPWYSIWSALAHQGEVYPASFAAVPHVIYALAIAPQRADSDYFQFPAWVEICRAKQGIVVPAELSDAYFEALARLPQMVALASTREWDAGFLACALSAIAASKGQHAIAEAVLEITSSNVAEDFLNWHFEQ